MATNPASGSVQIGQYRLEFAPGRRTFAVFEVTDEQENASALAVALAEEPHTLSRAADSAEEVEESADALTGHIERAKALTEDARSGQLLDQDAFRLEVDTLLDLLERLDRSGRFKDELRLLRALYGFLLLTQRWLELARSLRTGLSAARAAGDQEAQAWALHELGSLHLTARDPERALERLREASELEQKLGDAAGNCASRHNLECARRDLAARGEAPPPPRRFWRLLAFIAGALVLAGGGAAIAVAIVDQGGLEVPSTSSQTETGTTSSTTSTTTTSTTSSTTTSDTTSPTVTFDAPSGTITTQTPEFSGTAGTELGDQPEVTVDVFAASGNEVAAFPLTVDVVDGIWKITSPSTLDTGPYTASVMQRDDAGNPPGKDVTAFIVETPSPG
jgi:Bacterial Ig-like domain